MMENNYLWILITRKLTGTATEADLTELDNIIEKDSDSQEQLEIITSYWNLPSGKEADTQNAFEELQIKLKRLELINKCHDLKYQCLKGTASVNPLRV